MKRLFTFLMALAVLNSFAQNNSKPSQTVLPHTIYKTKNNNTKTAGRDTVIEKDTTKENQEPQYYYLSINTDVFVNTKGGAGKRLSPAVEFGRTFGIIDIGLATGKQNSLSSGGDTTWYMEFRPTINIFSKGRFAEGLCLGAGYVFKARQSFMTEICNSINFNVSETFALAITQGYCFFDGSNSNRSTQYMGLSLTYNFLKKHSTNMRRKKQAIISDN